MTAIEQHFTPTVHAIKSIRSPQIGFNLRIEYKQISNDQNICRDNWLTYYYTGKFRKRLQPMEGGSENLHICPRIQYLVKRFAYSRDNKPSESNGHTTHLRGVASSLLMRTAISTRQWQPWTAVSSLLVASRLLY